MIKKLTPFKLCVLQNFPFIEADFDALTNYELMCKIVEYLNKLAEEQNITNDKVNELIDKFNNLNLQEEVNKKLDEMALDGTLGEIISNYIDNNVTRTYNTLIDLLTADLVSGIKVKTLGYHTINDGGSAFYYITNIQPTNSIYETLTNGNYAVLVIEDDFINVKKLGAYGDNTNDDTNVIQMALNTGLNVYIPEGTYLITQKLQMPFNITLKGFNKRKTVLNSTIQNDYTIQYGSTYDYNGLSGKISDLRIRSNNNANEKPYGIYMNSALIIENVDFYAIGQVINRSANYIDCIKIDNVYIGYCVPNGAYLINLNGNQDALEINQLKVATYTDDETQYNGIYVNRCHGGSINNSIINFNITIENTNAFSINECHTEWVNAQINIINSQVEFNNYFKHKSITNHDILIKNTSNLFNTIATLNNCYFSINGQIFDRIDYALEEIGDFTGDSVLILNNTYRSFNFADKNQTSLFLNGIKIKDNLLFNTNTNNLSIHSVIKNKNVVDNLYYYVADPSHSGMGGVTRSNATYWKAIAESKLYYRLMVVCDETRKLYLNYSNESNVSDILVDGSCPAISPYVKYIGNIYIYRGTASNSYNKRCNIGIINRGLLIDNGISVNGNVWEEIDTTNATGDYNACTSYQKINNNVIVESTAIPTKGTWTKGDKVINTNIATGNNKGWIYTGSEWISLGTY